MSKQEPLNQVITLAEASMMWKLDRKTIIWQYWYGSVDMRKSVGTWLVTIKSMTEVYGPPVEKPLPEFG